MAPVKASSSKLSKAGAFNFVLKVQVLSAHVHENRAFYASVDVDGNEKRTNAAEGRGEVIWNETFCFEANDQSALTVTLHKVHRINVKALRDDVIVGKIKDELKNLATYEGVIELELDVKSKKKPRIRISVVRGSDSDVTLELSLAVKNAAEIVGRMKGKDFDITKLDLSSVDNLLQEAWSPLMDRIAKFTKLADDIAELSPYAKTAWELISLAYKLFVAQVKRDMRIINLLETIWDAYEFVELANPLAVIESLEGLIKTLCAQTTECAYFIRRYATMTSLSLRFLTNVGSDVDNELDKYEKKFRELQDSIVRRSTIQTTLSVYRIEAKVEEIAMNVIYDRLKYQSGARHREHSDAKEPPPPDVLGLVLRWANSTQEQTPRLFIFSCKDEDLTHSLATDVCKVLDQGPDGESSMKLT